MDTLTRFGREARDEQTIPEEWSAVVEGRASPEDLARLGARAESDPETAALLAAFTPMSVDDEDALAERLLQRTTTSSAPTESRPARRPHWARRTVVALAAVAVAAAALVAVRPSGPDALPSYALEAATGDLDYRGAGEEARSVPEHRASSALSIVLRPDRPVHAEITVRTSVRYDGRTVEWPLPVEISPRRAIRLDGRAGALLPEVYGPMTILFTIAGDGAAPQVVAYDLVLLED